MDTLSFRCTPDAKGTAVLVEALINGASPTQNVLDIGGVLFGGALDTCAYDLYTCSCGHAGCAGFHEPLRQRRAGGTVEWLVEDEKLVRLLGTTRLVFDAAQFDAARAALKAELEAFEQQGLSAECLVSSFAPEEGEEPEAPMTLQDLAGYQIPYFQEVAALNAAIAAADGDAPVLVRQGYSDTAGNITVFQHPETAGAIAAQLLALGGRLSAQDAAEAANIPVVADIVRAFVATGDAKAAEQAYAPLRPDVLATAGTATFQHDAQGPLVCVW